MTMQADQSTKRTRKPRVERPRTLNFQQIESLRKHMLMTVGDLAHFFDVSRETYYTWMNGGYPRPKREAYIRARIKELLHVLTVHNWPTPDVIAATPRERYKKLLAVVGRRE